jgi:PKD repeat protein
MKKGILAFVLIAVYAVLVSSCSSNPAACFTITTVPDSIKVGHTVAMDAGCSTGATQYYWDFGNGKNSSTGPATTVIYDSIGTYTISLVVSGSSKTATASKSVVVKP